MSWETVASENVPLNLKIICFSHRVAKIVSIGKEVVGFTHFSILWMDVHVYSVHDSYQEYLHCTCIHCIYVITRLHYVQQQDGLGMSQ